MRAILDTNILVAALFWHGRPHRLLEHVRDGSLSLITSVKVDELVNELLKRGIDLIEAGK